MTDKEFVNGLLVKAPHEKAPHFVKCSLSIKRKDFGNWLREKTDEWINVDVKVSREGKWYCEVNNWKPKAADGVAAKAQDDGFNDEIPFN